MAYCAIRLRSKADVLKKGKRFCLDVFAVVPASTHLCLSMGQAETKSEPSLGTRGQLQKWIEEHSQAAGHMSEVRQLVLVGPKGSGKSSSGNSILGREAFKTGTRTLICQTEICKVEDHIVILVDTPALTGKKNSNQEVTRVIKKACQDLLELPVVFLLVVPMGWNVKKIQDYKPVLIQALGNVSPDYVMVLLTHADQMDQQEETMEESILRKGGLLQLTTGRCGGWSYVLNIAESNRTQILELLKKVDRMMQDRNPKEQSGKKDMSEKLDKPQTLEEGADYSVAISHQRRRVQKRVDVIRNSERIIAENKGLLRKLRDDIETLEEDLKEAVGEEQKQALVKKIQVKAEDIKAKEEKIQLHIEVLQTLQQQVEEKRHLISEMEKEMKGKEKEYAKTQQEPPERKETAGQIHSIRKNLQKLEDQLKNKREEEEEQTRGRNLEYRAQLQKIKENMGA
ncbi:uncharacterized protein LOC103024615 [Astyanax mexicanus]|uniref:uncharacterized protein LOC103024615 n=1 Tax=Astyanax mexicanus TaxID=7994 RepID=UPI0020CB1F08|nr:uncharacterized protein LOC103024615 [Astyanax mexicanus]